MLHSQYIGVLLLWLCVTLVSSVFGLPAWGPAANRGPIGGPSWNGGPDQSTDNIILHSKPNWRY
ncbi:uncharacterized protein Dwil_GK19305 [Drosophila willistoni]|uniref:Uncharacterized protein n=1 Tax=Drosophila willistoni TaxID=7260 RepID=B4MKF6_DROWI|nr:uncharacterized protein LOC6638421 isoform X1 [Drosophila willistoni]EDW72595.2 uncharacterized protein Dwil_GK19305 [Drosophila willistoni]